MFGLGEGPYIEGSLGWGESVPEGQETSGDVSRELVRGSVSYVENIA